MRVPESTEDGPPLPLSHHIFLEQLADVFVAPLLSQPAHEERAILIGRQHAQEPAVVELEAVHGVDGPVRLLARGEAHVTVPAAPAAPLVARYSNLGDLSCVLKPIPQHVATCAPGQPAEENLNASFRNEVEARPGGSEVHAPLSVVVAIAVESVREVAAVLLLAYLYAAAA